jgi:hypothetical protein
MNRVKNFHFGLYQTRHSFDLGDLRLEGLGGGRHVHNPLFDTLRRSDKSCFLGGVRSM